MLKFAYYPNNLKYKYLTELFMILFGVSSVAALHKSDHNLLYLYN